MTAGRSGWSANEGRGAPFPDMGDPRAGTVGRLEDVDGDRLDVPTPGGPVAAVDCRARDGATSRSAGCPWLSGQPPHASDAYAKRTTSLPVWDDRTSSTASRNPDFRRDRSRVRTFLLTPMGVLGSLGCL